MTRHRYPTRALAGDYARAVAGLALALPPLVVVPLNRYVAALFVLLVALFVVFAWRTLMRQLATVTMSDSGIAFTGARSIELPWAAIDDLKLAYFATRRDGSGGWMQLGLRGGRRRLQLDSRIQGFPAIVACAARAAAARQLPLSATTTTNLAALGITAAPGEQR